ncbi:MAG: PA0069 family radical SAM protein [Bacteroidota bacterium]
MKGRGTQENPKIRFESLAHEAFDDDWNGGNEERRVPTQFFRDESKSILTKNDSPDLGFTFGLNPYRGCEHGCIYCYARPTHEYLGFSSGLDFETKIMVKEDAPQLLEQEFRKKSWKPDVVMLSGNVDCYQPVERKLGITRRCLEVFLRYRNPVSMITKNALVVRDIDLISQLASLNLVSVCLSITTLDRDLARRMEPRTSAPEQRLQAIEQLAKARIPVSVNAAPVIPGLNDDELPSILREASARGATSAGYTLLRLPFSVKDLFVDWLKREFPSKSERVINRIMDVRNGKMNVSNFSTRMKGEGEIALSIAQLFRASCKKYGLSSAFMPLATDRFVRPASDRKQEEIAFS